ncbi:hypothetical protein [Gluconacetobacter asukensis]|uniref:Uncharacterized protein n=1 Tax=Gluconacetobacter asukensis TaxID=1017181 RepID=A0A7W4P0F9_9PROT|nr:hypothetical protein [Gluconacetobacter asukensis]MBB2172887.1 hypothetical protein [Gluconacetobacter asukensis]
MTDATCADPRLEDHERRLTDLERGQTRIEAGQRDLSNKMSEMHGENRIRAEHLDRTVGVMSDQLSALASMRGWAKWAFVIGGSSFAGSVLSHFATLP